MIVIIAICAILTVLAIVVEPLGWAFRQIAENVWIAYQSAGPVVRLIVPSGVVVTSALLMKLLKRKLSKK